MSQILDSQRQSALARHADAIAAACRDHQAAEAAAADAPTLVARSGAAAATSAGLADYVAGYRILKEIHRGGQGVVYQAIQNSTQRTVAIKVLHEGPFAGASDRTRFEREVQVLAQLDHPNIVGILDSGAAAGSHYFVMDYVAGQSLDEYMSASPPSIAETLTLFSKICEAVNAAHLCGIIHRDLKPGNIRVDASGEPHILDFGLAKISSCQLSVVSSQQEEAEPCDTKTDSRKLMTDPLTETGQFVGSLPWASPEQAGGATTQIDVRTDVYSLGVILYQMLTGRFPYEVGGNLRDVLDRILTAVPARPSTFRVTPGSRTLRINDEIETIVLKCLSKERERRYQSAGELGQDVRRYLNGEPIEAKRDSGWYVLRKLAHRHWYATASVASLFVILVSFASVAFVLYRDARDNLGAAQRNQEAEQERQRELQEQRDAVQAALGRMQFESFLLAWELGQSERAREIRNLPITTPDERMAMSYLLESERSDTALLAALDNKDEALAQLALAERRRQRGESAAAAAAYRSAIDAPGRHWAKRVAAQRIITLSELSPDTQPVAEGPK